MCEGLKGGRTIYETTNQDEGLGNDQNPTWEYPRGELTWKCLKICLALPQFPRDVQVVDGVCVVKDELLGNN